MCGQAVMCVSLYEATSYTPPRYAAFLERKYRGDIGALNGAWGVQLGWFDQARTSPLRPLGADLDSGERRMWLYWCRFNSDRVTSWLRGLRAALRAVDTCHLCSAKLNTGPNLDIAPLDNGIDRVGALREMDISGLDSSFSPPAGDGHTRGARHGAALTSYDTLKYTADWLPVAGAERTLWVEARARERARGGARTQCGLLLQHSRPGAAQVDVALLAHTPGSHSCLLHPPVGLSLLKSVAPAKLVFDSEWHLVTDCCVTPR